MNYIERKMFTMEGIVNSRFTLLSAIPQGSNLGPILFAIFINSLAKLLQVPRLLLEDYLNIFLPLSCTGD